MLEVNVAQLRFVRQPLPQGAPEVGALRFVLLGGEQRRRPRYGLVEAGEERAQRLQRLANGVTPQRRLGVGRVDRVRQRRAYGNRRAVRPRRGR